MVLWDYEKKGYDTYRLKSSDGCCENCANEDGKEFSIKDIEKMEYFLLIHPNCRCKAEILNEDGKIVHTIDEKTAWAEIEKQKISINALDVISNLLTAASLIPGVDTIADLASIPVDLLRGDFVSAGLDAFGAIPIIGEVADTAKIADKAVELAKVAGKSSKGTKLLSMVSNSKLKNTIKEMYRPGAKVGDGGLADAIRHELKTGEFIGGKSHIQKGKERLKNLERIFEHEPLTKQERKITEDLIEDLRQALGGK